MSASTHPTYHSQFVLSKWSMKVKAVKSCKTHRNGGVTIFQARKISKHLQQFLRLQNKYERMF